MHSSVAELPCNRAFSMVYACVFAWENLLNAVGKLTTSMRKTLAQPAQATLTFQQDTKLCTLIITVNTHAYSQLNHKLIASVILPISDGFTQLLLITTTNLINSYNNRISL